MGWTGAAGVEVRRAGSRDRTEVAGIRTWHSFSFGEHYDPRNTGFGLLIAHNDEEVAPGAGYPAHRHRDVEIVTWVVDGVLVHRHGDGSRHLLQAGSVQRLHAGSGVVHSEGALAGRALRFVQVWLPSGRPAAPPSYESRDLAAELAAGGSVVAASGLPRHAGGSGVRLVHPGAALHVVRPVGEVRLPAASALHLYVVSGRVEVDGAGQLGEGDAARVTGVPAPALRPVEAAEVLVWETYPAG